MCHGAGNSFTYLKLKKCVIYFTFQQPVYDILCCPFCKAVIIVLCAGPDPSVAFEPGNAQEFSRICLFDVQSIKDRDIDNLKLIKVGDAIVSGSPDNLCFLQDRKGAIVFVIFTF